MDYTLEHPYRQAHARLVREEALALASLGLRVVPLLPDSKQPAIRNWQKRATHNPDRVPTLFPEGAPLNLGVCIKRYQVVVDIDPRHGGHESFAELTEKYGHPPATTMSMTGGGGFHSLFTTRVPIRTQTNFMPGIDILGIDALMTVPPSRHAETGQLYDWIQHPTQGISILPDWFEDLIGGTKRYQPRGKGRPLVADRTADPRRLASDLVERYPVRACGTRHSQMVRAIGSLLGRGYRPDVVLEAMETWHTHVLGLGTTRTSVSKGRAEAEECIRLTLGNEKFHRAVGVTDHHKAIAEIKLTERQSRLIREGVIGEEGIAESPAWRGFVPLPRATPCKSLTLSTGINKRLCASRDEIAFVEVICLHLQHKIALGECVLPGTFRATNDQFAAIAQQRHSLTWEAPQIERLKRKFIGRPNDNKPATRYELLREIVKGHRRSNETVGVPSEYQPTGILDLARSPLASEA